MTMLRDNVDEILDILKSEKIILYPTDTVWGIGCDSLSQEAYERIFALKGRPVNKSAILLVDSLDMLKNYVIRIHPKLENLLVHHQKPLTIIYNNPTNLPSHVLAEDGSVALRICNEPFCQSIISRLGNPLVSTSANVSDRPTPSFFGEIDSDILGGVDYVCKYRRQDKKSYLPSSIIKLTEDDELLFIRD